MAKVTQIAPLRKIMYSLFCLPGRKPGWENPKVSSLECGHAVITNTTTRKNGFTHCFYCATKQKYEERLQYWDSGFNLSNDILITLNRGWTFDKNGHIGVRVFETREQAERAILKAYPCTCNFCLGLSSSIVEDF